MNERQYTNRNDQTNAWYVNRYLNAFRKNGPMPDAENEWKIDSMLIKALNVEAINAMAAQVITDKNQVSRRQRTRQGERPPCRPRRRFWPSARRWPRAR